MVTHSTCLLRYMCDVDMAVCSCSQVNVSIVSSRCDYFGTSFFTLAPLRHQSEISWRSLRGKQFGRTVMRQSQRDHGIHGDADIPVGQMSRIDLKLGEMDAYALRTTANKSAALLLLTDVYGFDADANQDFAHRLWRLGYNVLVPDLFHGLPWNKGRCMGDYEEWRSRHPAERVARDVDTAATWLRTQINGTKIGLIGFCFGGGRVLEALARDESRQYATAVSFYPTRFDSSIANHVNVPVLLISGDMDELCSPLELRNIASLIKDSKCQIYPGRGHAFAHRPSATDHDDALDAFTVMESWLSDKLQ